MGHKLRRFALKRIPAGYAERLVPRASADIAQQNKMRLYDGT